MKYDVSVRKVTPDSSKTVKIVGYADVTLDEQFVIKGIMVKEGQNGMFIDMPKGKSYEKEGKTVYPDIFSQITADARTELTKAVIDKYNET